MPTRTSFRCSTRRTKLAHMNPKGQAAMEHWQKHLPERYAKLQDPIGFFTRLGEEAAARYMAIRDADLAGLNPNDGTISWAEWPDRVAQAHQKAMEIVDREMIYLAPEDLPED